jgi:hypothetical protein
MCVAAAEGRRTACVFPSGPPYRFGKGAEHVGAVQAVAHHPDVGNLKAQARSHGPFGATN